MSDSGFSSQLYWEKRYINGRNSGAGSYGRLAEYKSRYINDLVSARKIKSVIEFGSGDGNQASLFNFSNYTGVDVSALMVEKCSERFKDRKGWTFIDAANYKSTKKYDLSMSLDVIYHLIEDAVFDSYMHRLFAASKRFVLIYASDFDAPGPAVHVRHRNFSNWIAQHKPGWECVDAPEHPYPMIEGSNPNKTSFASFKLYECSK